MNKKYIAITAVLLVLVLGGIYVTFAGREPESTAPAPAEDTSSSGGYSGLGK